jgi:spore coat polysaccharide biosynthesis protein SpsF (cytidylyltransferase family)
VDDDPLAGFEDFWDAYPRREGKRDAQKAWKQIKAGLDPELREHPHRYFEQCGLLQLPTADLRLDVNTQADYEFIQDIYDHLYPTNPHFTTTDILAYLDRKKVSA